MILVLQWTISVHSASIEFASVKNHVGVQEFVRPVMRIFPLSWYFPFRLGVVSFRRGNIIRNICTAIVKQAAVTRKELIATLDVHPLDRPDLSFEAADSMVMDAVFWSGVQGYEGCVAAIWQNLCQQSLSVLEIGANVGLFTVVGAKATTGRYTAVEPIPMNEALLRRNLARNGISAVEVLRAAVIPGDTARDVALSIPSEGRGAPVGAHLVDDVEVSGRDTSEVITVRGLPFADLIAGRDLIKIDAEGIEFELLSGSLPELLAGGPTLLLEVLPEAKKLGQLVAEIADAGGYMIYVLPEYRLDAPVLVPSKSFTSATPETFYAKDVLLSKTPI